MTAAGGRPSKGKGRSSWMTSSTSFQRFARRRASGAESAPRADQTYEILSETIDDTPLGEIERYTGMTEQQHQPTHVDAAPAEQQTGTARRARTRRPSANASAHGTSQRNAAEPILPEEVVDAATTSSREAIVEPATPRASRHGGGISPDNTVFVSLCFEGPDIYSMAGGLGTRVTEFTESLAQLGYETHLIFVGDPTKPASEDLENGKLHLQALEPVDQPVLSQRRL